LLLIVVGFFLSDLTVDYDSLRSSASIMAKGINLLFISIGNYKDIGYSMYYGKTYGLVLLVTLFVMISYKYCKTDF
jgi:glucose uptake protein GlcU